MLNQKKRGKSHKKAQISMFIIIGIILIASVVGIQYAGREAERIRLQAQADRIVAELRQKTALNYYVTLCLRKVTEKAVFLAFHQGGNIYDYQTGKIPMPQKNIPFYEYTISYAITRQPVNNIFPAPPEYPFANASIFSRTEIPYYGRLSLPALCDIEGPNKPGTSFILCSRYGRNSIQEQITDYIKENLDDCVNFSAIRAIQNVTTKEPEVTFTLGENNVFVKAVYPIEISLGVLTPLITLADFSVDLDLRIRKIYDVAYNALRRNTLEPDFNLVRDFKKSLSWDSSIKMSLARPFFPNNFDSVLTVTDEASIINAIPLKFRTAIENRIPVLEYINPSLNPEYNVIVLENETIFLNPEAYDSENNPLTFIYRGWKENYDEYFDEACCREQPNRCYQNTTEVEKCTKKIELLPGQGHPRNWTRSNEFLETKRNASYHTTRQDIGIHNTTIFVYDDTGLADWQHIKILVMDIAEAEASSSSILDGIPEGIASVEDPYILDASESTAYFTESLKYKWENTYENFTIETGKRKLVIPEEFTIMDITEKIFKKSLLAENPTEHNITLYLTPGQSSSTTKVLVYQCLPFYDSESPPWPFNTTDPFYSKHSCCDDSEENYGTYLSSDTVCFEKTEFGGLLNFQPDLIAGYKIEPAQEIIYLDKDGNQLSALVYSDLNDIWKRTYQRRCSGDRGNVCTGPSLEIRQKAVVSGVEYPCPVTNSAVGEDETCSYQFNTFEDISTTSLLLSQCRGTTNDFSYGETFEFKYKQKLLDLFDEKTSIGIPIYFGNIRTRINTADNICNPTARRANEFLQFSSTGPFLCLSRCDLQGKCNKPFQCRCYTGIGSTGSEQCNNIMYETLYSKGYEYIDRSGEKGICNKKCEFFSVDQNKQSCEYFFKAGTYNENWNWNAYSETADGQAIYTFPGIYEKNCCGDDAKEILASALGDVSWQGKTACCYDYGGKVCVDDKGNCIKSDIGASSCTAGKMCINGEWKTEKDSDKDGYDDQCDLFPTNACSALIKGDLCNKGICIPGYSLYESTCS